MTTYTSVFGNSAIPSSDNSYRAIALTGDTTFYWPDLAIGDNLLADTIDVTANAAWSMTFPVANQVSVGRSVALNNKSAFTITVKDTSGNTLGTVAEGVSKLFLLTDNSTANGTWSLYTLGTGTSAADASALAGLGLVALGGLLNGNIPVLAVTNNLTLTTAHRNTCLDFTVASKTLTLMLAATATSGYMVLVKNSNAGSVTIAASGSDHIDLVTTFDLSPQESVVLLSDGANWIILNRGVSTTFQFTKLVKDISSATSFTLTSSEASNKLMQFIGTPTADTTVNVPAVVAVYYVQNVFTNNGFSLTIKTAAGTGVELAYADKVILYCDGVNVVTAQTTDSAAAAASAAAALLSENAAAASAAAALLSENAAANSEANAGNSATLASQWATLTSGQVASTDYSAKAYAIGGTGVTTAIGASKEWAVTTGSAVITGAYSAKEWATGTFTRGVASGGSAKDWATYTSSTVDNAEYSAKSYAVGGTGVTSVLGAAKEWAVTTGATVIAGAYSAKEWAVGTFTRGAASGGSAKDWATYTSGTVDNAEYSAKKYAQDAASSASTASSYASALTSTSTTTLTPALGAQTFTTQASKGYASGQFFSAVSASNAAVYMHGTVTSYSSTSLVVNVTDIGTATSKSDWALSVSGSQGSTGATGAGVPANLTLTNPASAATLTVASGSTLTTVGAFGSTLTFTNTTNATIPAGTVTLAALGVAQSWTAAQTFAASGIKLLGSSTGATTFTSANAGASNYTITVPAVTDTLAVKGSNTFTAAQIGTVQVLTVSANAVAVDLALANDFSLALQATTGQTLSNPTNAVAGQSGQITITQNATPSTLAYGSNWIPYDGVTPAVSTTASAQNLLSYYVADSTHVWFSLAKHGVT